MPKINCIVQQYERFSFLLPSDVLRFLVHVSWHHRHCRMINISLQHCIQSKVLKQILHLFKTMPSVFCEVLESQRSNKNLLRPTDDVAIAHCALYTCSQCFYCSSKPNEILHRQKMHTTIYDSATTIQ